MWDSRTILRFGLAAALLANTGGALANDLPAEAPASTDARHASAEQPERDVAATLATPSTGEPAVAAQDVKTMVEDEVRLQLSQRLAAFTPPS